MKIRPEISSDIDAVRALTARAFASAPRSDGSEPRIVDRLRNAGALAVSLVADDDGTIIGHIAASPVSIADGTSGWYGLGPISVEPSFQGRGIGTRLMHAGLDALRHRGTRGCVVLGEPAFYARFGFTAAHPLVFPGPPAEYFLAVSFSASQPHGQVAYHPAFSS